MKNVSDVNYFYGFCEQMMKTPAALTTKSPKTQGDLCFEALFTLLMTIDFFFLCVPSGFVYDIPTQPSATSRIIMIANPTAKPMVPMLECSPSADSGISSSTTT